MIGIVVAVAVVFVAFAIYVLKHDGGIKSVLIAFAYIGSLALALSAVWF